MSFQFNITIVLSKIYTVNILAHTYYYSHTHHIIITILHVHISYYNIPNMSAPVYNAENPMLSKGIIIFSKIRLIYMYMYCYEKKKFILIEFHFICIEFVERVKLSWITFIWIYDVIIIVHVCEKLRRSYTCNFCC